MNDADSAEFTRPVAARFVVSLDSFTISHTRAQSADTVHLALAGIFGNEKKELLNSCNNVLGEPTVAKPILCKGPSRYGMSALGKGIYPARMKVGEFEIVPGIGGALSFAFAVFNYGFPIQATSFSGSMEGNVRGALKGQVLTLNQIPDDDFISNLNGPPWLGCDGPTAAGGVRLFNGNRPGSLDAVTRGTGVLSGASKTYVVKSQAGCGGDSRYQIRWSVRRTTWK